MPADGIDEVGRRSVDILGKRPALLGVIVVINRVAVRVGCTIRSACQAVTAEINTT